MFPYPNYLTNFLPFLPPHNGCMPTPNISAFDFLPLMFNSRAIKLGLYLVFCFKGFLDFLPKIDLGTSILNLIGGDFGGDGDLVIETDGDLLGLGDLLTDGLGERLTLGDGLRLMLGLNERLTLGDRLRLIENDGDMLGLGERLTLGLNERLTLGDRLRDMLGLKLRDLDLENIDADFGI